MTSVKFVTSLISSIAIGLILCLDMLGQRSATFSGRYPSYAKILTYLHGEVEKFGRMAEMPSMRSVKLVISVISSIAIGLILWLDILGQR